MQPSEFWAMPVSEFLVLVYNFNKANTDDEKPKNKMTPEQFEKLKRQVENGKLKE